MQRFQTIFVSRIPSVDIDSLCAQIKANFWALMKWCKIWTPAKCLLYSAPPKPIVIHVFDH